MAVTDGLGGIISGLGIDTSGVGGAVGNFMVYLIIFLAVAAIVGVALYFTYQKKIYNQKLTIFEEVNGRTTPKEFMKAKEVNIPNTTIKIFVTQSGMILPRPTIPTGKNNYLYYIRSDSEWINFRLKNMNQQLNEMGIEFDHTDMRYAHVALKDLIKQNYGEKNFWKEYGAYVALGILVVGIGIAFYLIADRLADSATTLAESTVLNAETTRMLVDKLTTSGIKVN